MLENNHVAAAPGRVRETLAALSGWLGLGVLTGLAGLFMLQYVVIYWPRAYDDAMLANLPAGAEVLEFETSAGRQQAYLVPARSGAPAQALWVLFHGKAGTAPLMSRFARECPDDGAAFLLIEYPGIGEGEGLPRADSVLEVSEAATEKALECLEASGAPRGDVRLCGLGVSLGSAALLQWAARQDVDRLILIAPLTSLREVAFERYGFAAHLLRDGYDNRARMGELARRDPRPQVTIFHGDADESLSVDMGAALAAVEPAMSEFVVVRGADHRGVTRAAWDQIMDAMVSGR